MNGFLVSIDNVLEAEILNDVCHVCICNDTKRIVKDIYQKNQNNNCIYYLNHEKCKHDRKTNSTPSLYDQFWGNAELPSFSHYFPKKSSLIIANLIDYICNEKKIGISLHTIFPNGNKFIIYDLFPVFSFEINTFIKNQNLDAAYRIPPEIREHYKKPKEEYEFSKENYEMSYVYGCMLYEAIYGRAITNETINDLVKGKLLEEIDSCFIPWLISVCLSNKPSTRPSPRVLASILRLDKMKFPSLYYSTPKTESEIWEDGDEDKAREWANRASNDSVVAHMLCWTLGLVENPPSVPNSMIKVSMSLFKYNSEKMTCDVTKYLEILDKHSKYTMARIAAANIRLTHCDAEEKKKAIEVLKTDAQKGSIEAKLSLGRYLPPEEINNIKTYLTEAADFGCVKALLILASRLCAASLYEEAFNVLKMIEKPGADASKFENAVWRRAQAAIACLYHRANAPTPIVEKFLVLAGFEGKIEKLKLYLLNGKLPIDKFLVDAADNCDCLADVCNILPNV